MGIRIANPIIDPDTLNSRGYPFPHCIVKS